MKISIRKSNLLQGINIVSKAVSNKTTHPILSCILVEAAGGVIKLTANDMEIGIESYVDGTVIEDGKVALEAKLFSDFIRKLPDSDITIESDKDSKTLIKCERLEFNIPGKSGEDFSNLPVVSKDKFITISQFALRHQPHKAIEGFIRTNTGQHCHSTPVTGKPGRKCRNKFFKRHGIPEKGKICHIRNGLFRWLANPGHSWLPAYPLRLKLRDAVYRGQGKCHPVKGFRHIMVHFPHLLNMFNGAPILGLPVNEQNREMTFSPAGHLCHKMEKHGGILST